LYFVSVVALAAAARTCDFMKERGNFPGGATGEKQDKFTICMEARNALKQKQTHTRVHTLTHRVA